MADSVSLAIASAPSSGHASLFLSSRNDDRTSLCDDQPILGSPGIYAALSNYLCAAGS